MPFNLLLNSSNVNNSDNTSYLYKFVNGSFEIEEGAEICISQIVIPYSFFNLNKGLYNNTTFQFIINAVTYTVVIPDGFYTTSDINNYLEQYFITNNMYCTDDATGKYVFFIYLYTNTTYYANQFIVSPVISSSIAGYTFPFGYINPSATDYATPQIVFPSTGGLNSILGFTAGTYPSGTSTITSLNFLSNITPNATPINSIVVRTNLCNNNCATPSDILDTISISGTTFGSNITYTPTYEKWINCNYGTFNNFFVYFQDQNLNRIQAQDNNVLISLIVRQGRTLREKLQEQTTEKPQLVKTIEPLTFKE